MEENSEETPDLVELLEADHRRLERMAAAGSVDRDLIREVETHLVAEAQLLYPALRRHLPDADDAVDDLLDVDHEIEEAMEEVEASRPDPDPEAVAELNALLARHFGGQERLFASLRQSADPDELRRLGEALGLTLAQAPTHPHPHLPREGPLEVIADTVASGVDHLRDVMRRDHADE